LHNSGQREGYAVLIIGYILLAATILGFAIFLLSAPKIAAYPFGLDFGEGYLLEHARRLGNAENIYGDISHYPYTVCNYPILYPLLIGLIMKATGVTLAAGRWVSIIATLASCWLVVFILLRLTRNQLISVICGLMFVCVPAAFRWGQVFRVDALAVALSLTGLAIFIAAGNDKRRLWSIPFFIAAFLTKQSMLAAFAAVLLHTLYINRRSGLLYAALALIGGAVVYMLIDYATAGGMFRHNFLFTANAFFPERLAAGLKTYLLYTGPLILIALFHLGYGKPILRDNPLPLYFLFANATMLTYGYEGSDSNYFIEPLAADLLIAGVALSAWVPRIGKSENNLKLNWAGVLLVVILLAQFLMVRGFYNNEFQVAYIGERDIENGKLLVNLIKNTPGDVVSEDASFQVSAGKPVLFEPYIMTLLAEQGKWDQTDFVNDLRNAHFGLVILRFNVFDPNNPDRYENLPYRIAGFNRFSDEMEQAIAEGYELDKNLIFHSHGTWFAYNPRGN